MVCSSCQLMVGPLSCKSRLVHYRVHFSCILVLGLLQFLWMVNKAHFVKWLQIFFDVAQGHNLSGVKHAVTVCNTGGDGDVGRKRVIQGNKLRLCNWSRSRNQLIWWSNCVLINFFNPNLKPDSNPSQQKSIKTCPIFIEKIETDWI